jgi:RAC serine/threonine-protein kinase
LRDDGTLVGFKAKPDQQMAAAAQPLNNFTVRGCQIMSVDRPKPFTFVIRGLQWTTVIERTFHVETEQDREDWVTAIRYFLFYKKLNNILHTCLHKF